MSVPQVYAMNFSKYFRLSKVFVAVAFAFFFLLGILLRTLDMLVLEELLLGLSFLKIF